MSEEEKTKCECDCDCEEDDDVITLVDDEGNETEFYHVATLEHEGKFYAYLQEVTENDEEGCIEIFELEESDEVKEGEEGYYSFLPIDDDLYEVLYDKLMKEIEEHDEECDCGCHEEG